MLRGTLIFLAVGSLWSCAGRQTDRGPRRTGTIQVAEIASVSATNAYDVVQQLRRGWLISRGPVSLSDPRPAYPTVYMDGVEMGDLGFLRSIAAPDIAEITFLSTSESNLRYGPGHFGGIIHVTTRRSEGLAPSGPLGLHGPALPRMARGPHSDFSAGRSRLIWLLLQRVHHGRATTGGRPRGPARFLGARVS